MRAFSAVMKILFTQWLEGTTISNKHKTKITDLSQTAPIFYIELIDNERMSHQSLH